MLVIVVHCIHMLVINLQIKWFFEVYIHFPFELMCIQSRFGDALYVYTVGIKGVFQFQWTSEDHDTITFFALMCRRMWQNLCDYVPCRFALGHYSLATLIQRADSWIILRLILYNTIDLEIHVHCTPNSSLGGFGKRRRMSSERNNQAKKVQGIYCINSTLLS